MELKNLIDLDFAGWFKQGLPESLLKYRDQFPKALSDFDDLEIEDFGALLTASLIMTHGSDLAHHNLGHHERVTWRGSDAITQYEDTTEEEIPLALKQGALLGFSRHDQNHPGSTFFADSESVMADNPAWADVAVEWQSARLFDEWAERHGIPVPIRYVAVYTIWASAYGAGTEHGNRLGLERVKPKGLIGLIMRAADIAPSDDIVTSLHSHIAVNYLETPAKAPARTITGFAEDQFQFLRYMAASFDSLDAKARFSLTAELGWQTNWQRHVQLNLELGMPDSVARAILVAELAAAGIELVD